MAIFRGDGGAGDANTDVTINSVTEKANAAATSASEAASSATSASTSASNASTSETNASNSATAAASSASGASTSASNASTSASTASTQATNASNSATAAASSATAAATSETNAETAETNAETAETNAASSASTATTKASEASTSATNAATSATTATTKASEASTSATNAATSATTASTQATNASNSASAASTSATNAATSATEAANSATAAAAELSTAALKANNLSDLANASTARDNLGLTIGTDVQGYSSVLANTTASFLTADESKLDGIEASADVTDTTNVTSAGALMDSEVTNLAQVKAFDTTDYATAAQGTKADDAAAKASNLSDLANVSTARDNLGVQINDDVIGYVTPSTSGNVLTSNGSAWTSAALPAAGKILQVVQGTTSTEVISTVTTDTDTTLTANITPSATSSKILVLVEQAGCGKRSGNSWLNLKLLRDTTTITTFCTFAGYTGTTTDNMFGTVSTSFLDTPSTTSQITYKTVMFTGNTPVNLSVQSDAVGAQTSTITLIEVAG